MTCRSVTLLAALALVLVAGPAAADEADAAKERLEKRYPTLLRLENEGKVGEIYSGFAGAVKAEYLEQKVDPADPESRTIRNFLTEENRDRLILYEKVAKGRDITAAQVGLLNGKKIFEKASPDHFLKPSGRDWIRKRDLDREK